jgi:integrase
MPLQPLLSRRHAPEEASPAPDVNAVRRLLLDVMEDASAVHFLAHLQEYRQWEGRTFTDLRVHLARLGIPVDRGVNVAGTPAWEVRRRDAFAGTKFTPHDFRRLFATDIVNGGLPIHIGAALL